MNEELKSYLDGELELSALSPESRREAEVWNAFLADTRAAGAPGAPVGLESRIMRAIEADSRSPWLARVVDWWVSPRPFRMRPAVGLAVAAIVALLVLPAQIGDDDGTSAGVADDEATYVQFILEAPNATTVHVAGDFTDWQALIALADLDGDGVWSGRVRLPPGVHEYNFVIDGTHWIADPYAQSYSEDRYGRRNSVLAITPGAGASSLAP